MLGRPGELFYPPEAVAAGAAGAALARARARRAAARGGVAGAQGRHALLGGGACSPRCATRTATPGLRRGDARHHRAPAHGAHPAALRRGGPPLPPAPGPGPDGGGAGAADGAGAGGRLRPVPGDALGAAAGPGGDARVPRARAAPLGAGAALLPPSRARRQGCWQVLHTGALGAGGQGSPEALAHAGAQDAGAPAR